MPDEKLVIARVAGRTAANDLADLYITTSKELHDQHGEHGIEASIAFLDTLRDNLIAIRPLKTTVLVSDPEPVRTSSRREPATDWSEEGAPDGFVLAHLNGEAVRQTDMAWGISQDGTSDLLWIPKSQMYSEPTEGDYIETWPVREWFCDKEGLDFSE